MSEETLLTASRRVVRFMNIDNAHGGFTTDDTMYAVHTLRRQLELASADTVDKGLLEAARAFDVCFTIDESRSGGLTSVDTLKAIEQLDKQVRKEAARASGAGEVQP